MLPKLQENWVSVLSWSIVGKNEQDEFKHNSFPGHGKAKLTDEGREIARLKKELHYAKMEAEILKKAIGNVFAAQIMWTTAKI